MGRITAKYILATAADVYATVGTVAGTSMVANTVAPDGLTTAGDSISHVAAIGSRVTFAVNIPGSGSILYSTDGKTTDTQIRSNAALAQAGLTNGADAPCFEAGTWIAKADAWLRLKR